MREVIILEIKEPRKSRLVQDFLKEKNIDYRLLAETQTELKEKQKEKEQLKKRLIEAYKRETKNKEFQKEMAVWEGVAGDIINDK